MSRIKSQTGNRALRKSGGNLISSDYEQIIELWFRLVTERQREFVKSRPLISIDTRTEVRSKRAHVSNHSMSA